MNIQPISFGPALIPPILGGVKTVTRRVVVQPEPLVGNRWSWQSGGRGFECGESGLAGQMQIAAKRAVGDQLWVKESWVADAIYDDMTPSQIPVGAEIQYPASGEVTLTGKPRISKFMPRWMSRISLEVTGSRVEKLQMITEEEAIAEGVYQSQPDADDLAWSLGMRASISGVWIAPGTRIGFGATEAERGSPQWAATARLAYGLLFDAIHHPGAWQENPWVEVISFKVLN